MEDPRGAPAMLLVEVADGSRIAIRPFPNGRRFARDIQRSVLAVGATGRSEAEARELVARALRAWYPRLEIHPRDELAGLAPMDRAWYVLRDGRIRRASALVDRLHAALSDARETTGQADEAVQRAREALVLAARPRPPRVRHRVSDAGAQESTGQPEDQQADEEPASHEAPADAHDAVPR